MNVAAIISILLPIIESFKPEFLAALKKLRERGALSDAEMAETEVKGGTKVRELEEAARLPIR
jgi:hypothetical protein